MNKYSDLYQDLSFVCVCVCNMIGLLIYMTLLFHAHTSKVFFFYLAISALLFFNIFSIFLNKNVINASDKVSLYCKSFVVFVFTVLIIIDGLLKEYLKGSPLIDFIDKIIPGTVSLISVTLIIDVYIQVVKLIVFKNKIVPLDEVKIGKEYLTSAEVDNIIKLINPNYEYLNKKKVVKAIDPTMLSRVQDIYIAKYKLK